MDDAQLLQQYVETGSDDAFGQLVGRHVHLVYAAALRQVHNRDMAEDITPWEAGLAWTVALDESRDFIGRAALEQQKAQGVPRELVGLVLEDKGVLRHGQRVLTDKGEGEILSGIFSPTLGKSVAFARVPAGARGNLRVDIRGRELPVRVVKYPFVRDGKSCL